MTSTQPAPSPAQRATLLQKARRQSLWITTAILFSILFLMVDWEHLSTGFPDLDNYNASFRSNSYLYLIIDLSWDKFLLSEGYWVYLIDGLNKITGNLDTSFYIVSLFTVSACALYILNRTRNILLLPFLINPAFVDMVCSQFRSALAVGLFYIGFVVPRLWIRAVLWIVAVSVHTSFLVFIGIVLVYETLVYLTKSFPILGRKWVVWGSAILGGFVITAAQGTVLASLNDRRAEAYFGAESGWMLMGAWGSMAIAHACYTYYASKRPIELEAYFYTFCCSLFFWANVYGSYGTRFVAVAIPALIVASGTLPSVQRRLMLAQFGLFSAIYFWRYWLA